MGILDYQSGAHSSARLERIPDKDEVRGSSPRGPTNPDLRSRQKLAVTRQHAFRLTTRGSGPEPTFKRIRVQDEIAITTALLLTQAWP